MLCAHMVSRHCVNFNVQSCKPLLILVHSCDPNCAGLCKPSHLLPLLMDVNAYDSFVDSIRLNAKQQRIFWKALGKTLHAAVIKVCLCVN